MVVVGAGPSGLTAAYHLLKRGYNVCVLERGGRPGEKNIMGGVMYLDYYKKAFPDELLPPYEREIEAEEHYFITSSSLAQVGIRKYNERAEAVTIFRSKFDPFLAGLVEKNGGEIVTDILVENVVDTGNYVKIVTDKDELSAEFVIGADGVNSIVARSANIREKFPPESLFVSVKEVIRLAPEVIEERFGLEPGKGTIIDIIGHPDYNLPGGGFLYTNYDTLSFGTGAKASFLIKHRVSVVDLLESMKKHPSLQKYISDGEVVEVSTHLIPYGDVPIFKPTFAKGRIFLVGDAMGSTTGDLSGLPIAFLSGIAVAEAISDEKVLKNSNVVYKHYLKKNGLLKIFSATRLYHLIFRRSEVIEKSFAKFLFGAAYFLNSVGEIGILNEIKSIFSEPSGVKKIRGDREKIQTLLERRSAEGFISLKNLDKCLKCDKSCLELCPGAVYWAEEGEEKIKIRDYRCLECGFCRYFCSYDNIEWSYPPGGKGVIYKYG